MADSTWNADGQLWPTLPPPLVPTPEDVRLVQAACPAALLAPDAAPRILVLGVTPALIEAPWPEGSELHSVDYDRMMIELCWKHPRGGRSNCARWQDMPFPDDHFDLVIGDCSFNAVPAVADYTELLREIARVSRPGAPLVARFFMQAEPRLTPQGVIKLLAGELAALPPPSVRLLLALAVADDDGSLRFREVADKVTEQWGDLDDYLATLGHDAAAIERTRLVLQSDQQLNYPTKRQILEAFAPWYADIEFAHPTYEVGRFCPIIRFS